MENPIKISGLFKYVEQLQGDTPWGSFLDTGTGVKSLQWISTLNTERWTAITASQAMAKSSQESYPGTMRDHDRLVVGNWVDPELLKGEQFDTVLVDYLVGAIDGFAPYWQDLVFERLRPLVKGRMYIIGLEPYVPVVEKDEVGLYVGDVGRFRDSCLLMARERPYREYPSDWIARHLQRAGFNIVSGKRFPIRFGERFVQSQMKMCRQRIARFEACGIDPAVTSAMTKQVDVLTERGLALIAKHNGLPTGYDYVIAAEPAR
ncbi:MAG: hypothetical protein LAT77_02620 [Aliidiomarina sp.]|uniref:hypothetical protein n=1 Tax=Aliidiomarina sp. TaxID=1872439 RepID=UPI0025C50730|nr:hypothetical protein [Aliidiomarina sp.]MCH8500786.1 hypothetical protein [Aliidiomarina sp.]